MHLQPGNEENLHAQEIILKRSLTGFIGKWDACKIYLANKEPLKNQMAELGQKQEAIQNLSYVVKKKPVK